MNFTLLSSDTITRLKNNINLYNSTATKELHIDDKYYYNTAYDTVYNIYKLLQYSNNMQVALLNTDDFITVLRSDDMLQANYSFIELQKHDIQAITQMLYFCIDFADYEQLQKSTLVNCSAVCKEVLTELIQRLNIIIDTLMLNTHKSVIVMLCSDFTRFTEAHFTIDIE